MKVLLLHTYSATNAGDGLLVTESIGLLKEAFGSIQVTVLALHPGTFAGLDATIIDADPRRVASWGPMRETLRSIDSFDFVAAVGGGYLRSGNVTEAVKSVIAHGIQLRAASRSRVPVAYLPQSIGPIRLGLLPLTRRALRRVERIYLRDDRSMTELDLPNARRVPDLALLAHPNSPRLGGTVAGRTVLTVRNVKGRIPQPVRDLASTIGPFDGYIQSTGAGNDDTEAMTSLAPVSLLSADEYLGRTGPRRVIVAVRLHAALMALNAGHYVVHLAYERKGYGAFADSGLLDYVHGVSSFDVAAVAEQVTQLLHDPDARALYDERLVASAPARERARAAIIQELRELAEGSTQ